MYGLKPVPFTGILVLGQILKLELWGTQSSAESLTEMELVA